MICADFLAGALARDGDSAVLLDALTRLYYMIDEEQRTQFSIKIEKKDAKPLAS